MGIFSDVFDITPTGMVINSLGENFGPAVLSASDQNANIDAMNTYIAGTMATTTEARRLQDAWLAWYGGLTWYQKNIDDSVGLEAFNKRNAFMRANTANSTEKQKVNDFLKKVPVINPVTGKPTLADANGDRVIPPEPLIPTTYKVAAVATSAGILVLVALKKLHII